MFGSNLSGRHGKGAALVARRTFGAVNGEGYGRTGNAYAIPTKDANLNSLPLASVATFVSQFLGYAKEHPELSFRVTRIAGNQEHKIKPMFKGYPPNCNMPIGW